LADRPGHGFAQIFRNGPTAVVLLHGQPGTAGDWEWVTPLVEDRYTLIIPDRPGYGSTGGAATGFAGNTSAVVALLDRLAIDSAVLVCHSWAGGIGLAAAISHPARVSGLVLVSSVWPGDGPAFSDRLLALPVVGEVLAATTIGGIGLVLGRRRVQSLASSRLRGWPQDAVTALTRLTGSGSRVWHSFVVEQRALLSELPGLEDGLGRIQVPTALVHGRSDHMVPVESAERLAAAIPGATLRTIPRVGHFLPHDRPEAVAVAIHEVAARAGP
jgi:pimeloyl-ACP methyl ester carboxylesterase